MNARKIGPFVKVVLAAVAGLCVTGGARTARAGPDPSLWDTIRAADIVALVRVVNTPVVQTQSNPGQLPDVNAYPPTAIQRLEGVETWKGRRFESLEREISLWRNDEGCTPGQTVVAFLSEENGA